MVPEADEMKLEVHIGGPSDREQVTHRVEIAREGNRVRARIDAREIEADAVEVAPGAYSILLDGRAFEVRVEPHAHGLRIHAGGEEFSAEVLDPRAWRARRGGVLEAEGRQQIIAPMPGKVVRVLVRAGDAVEAGQGLLVVEAMKMQNEVRAPKSGTVERLLVAEGQAVNAGDLLAIVS